MFNANGRPIEDLGPPTPPDEGQSPHVESSDSDSALLGTPLALPAPPTEEEKAMQLNVGGDSIALDSLGPMIVNSDGTLSRINNWNEMTEAEQQRTVRLLVKKRNLARLNALTTASRNAAPLLSYNVGAEHPSNHNSEVGALQTTEEKVVDQMRIQQEKEILEDSA